MARLHGFGGFHSGLPADIRPCSKRQASPVAAPAEAYIDTRTGSLVSLDDSCKDSQTRQGETSVCQPAYYCWKCRQWLPVKNPQKNGASVVTVQAISNRPINPHQRTQ